MSPEPRYRLISRADLPIRMKGVFTFSAALSLACDWNFSHEVEDMAFPEEVKE